MKKCTVLTALLLISWLLSGCSSPRPVEKAVVSHPFTLDQLLARMPARDTVEARWMFSSILHMGQRAVQEVCQKLEAGGTDRNAQAEFALQGLATYVIRQGGEADRLVFVSGVKKALDAQLPVQHTAFLLARLQVAGKGESIESISRFLANEQLCGPAAQAMMAIREGAEAPMLAALPGAGSNCRITLMKSLGELRSRAAVEALLKEAGLNDPAIRPTALFALANIGDIRAEEMLTRAAESVQTTEKNEFTGNLLLFARRQLEAGKSAKALDLCRSLLVQRASKTENHFRAAALELSAQIKGPDILDDLLQAMADSSKEFRVAALRLALRIPGESVTGKWVAMAGSARHMVRSEIFDMLGQRGDQSAYSVLTESINDDSGLVRRSAIEAAFQLKGVESLRSILNVLQVRKDSADLATVKKVLEQLPPTQVIPPVIEALPRFTPQAVAMLTELLRKYGSLVPLEPILSLTKKESSSIRLAALKASGAIATEIDQERLLSAMLGLKEESERSAAQKSLVTLCSRIVDPEKRADKVLDFYQSASPENRLILLRTLGRIGGTKALSVVMESIRSKDADVRDAAIRALADWPTIQAYDSLLVIARSKEKLNLRVLALRGCVRVVESATISPQAAVRYHEETLAAAERVDEKRLVLGALGNLRCKEALKLVIPFIKDDSLGLDASVAAGKISSGKSEKSDELGSSLVARAFIESEVPRQFRNQVMRSFDATAGMNAPPEGFKALFSGKDLKGWKGLVADPIERAKMESAQLAAAQVRADSSMRAHWSVADGTLVFDGKGESLCTVNDYEDFELLVDWKIDKEGDSGIYLRGSPQVQIWDPAQWPVGSGGLYNNQKNPSKPLQRADNPIGEWNTFRIRMIGERVWVYLNDVMIADSVVLENYWDRKIPIFPRGQIELQSHNAPLYFRNIFIREIPRNKTYFSGSLLNGSDLAGWKVINGKEGNWSVEDGILFTTGEGGGWLSTEREYDNFQLDLDFRLAPGGNSGVFLRSPRQGDPAYTGMEIQVLDDYASEYANLKPWQYCGSLYGVQAASPRVTKKAGEWQHYTIVAQGPRVLVTLNNQVIVDADLISHMDKESTHPGLKRRSGYIGLQCHSLKVEFRNITIKELE
ncbi:MAG: hypothetical protein HW407_75 [Bacteroidetes bacterium]|nr:hypothetical protein [Bacteroidota bacterium]